jgi:hypothetical protein
MRKTANDPAPPLVRIAEILAELGGTDANVWYAEAEALAATMPAAVTRDWRGQPCLGWVDAERLYLRTMRDRHQANQEQAERLAELERGQRGHVPGPTVEDPSTSKAEVF